jgi:hypothetical protein
LEVYIERDTKKLTRIVFGRGVGEKPCERERGGKREGNRGRAGSNVHL